jgi:hypothetical protein
MFWCEHRERQEQDAQQAFRRSKILKELRPQGPEERLTS